MTDQRERERFEKWWDTPGTFGDDKDLAWQSWQAAIQASAGAGGGAIAVLQHYAEQFCEGWCKENGGDFADCAGCKARCFVEGRPSPASATDAKADLGTLTSALRKFAPDLAEELIKRWNVARVEHEADMEELISVLRGER